MGWLAAVLPVAVIAACAELATAILNNSTLPVYFNKGLGIGTDVFPVLMIPFFVSEALFKLPLGVLSDRYGRKPLMVAGALVTVFTPIVLIHVHYSPGISVLLLFGLLRLLDGLGGASLWPALYAYVGDAVEESKRGKAMGLLNVVYMVGLAFGFLVGGFVDDNFGPVFTGDATFKRQLGLVMSRAGHKIGASLHHHGHAAISAGLDHAATATPGIAPVLGAPSGLPDINIPQHYFPSFYLASLLFGVSALVAVMAVRAKKRTARIEGNPEVDAQKLTWEGLVATIRSVPQFMVLAFTTFIGMGCIAPLVKLFAMDEFHLTEKAVGLLILWPALLIGATGVPIGHLADKWGKSRCVRLGFLLASVGLWGIPILHATGTAHEIGFIVSATVMGFGFVIAFPAWMALLSSLGGDRQRGTVLGAVSMAQGVGVLAGFPLGGWLYKHVGHIAPFAMSAALVTTATVLALLFVRESAVRLASEP